MNRPLADFLLDLLRDPEQLRLFNTEEGRAEILARNPSLTPGDKEALQSGDAADILRQLAVGPDEADQLAWFIGPGIKGLMTTISAVLGFGIKPPPPVEATRRAPSGTKTRPGALRRAGGRASRSKKSKASRKGGKAPARKRKAGKR